MGNCATQERPALKIKNIKVVGMQLGVKALGSIPRSAPSPKSSHVAMASDPWEGEHVRAFGLAVARVPGISPS